jgi:cell division protein FtsL
MEFDFYNIVGLIILLLIVIFLFTICLVLVKHFSKKNLQEKQINIIFASEKERDYVLTLIERDKQETAELEKQETAELEKQAKNFGLK